MSKAPSLAPLVQSYFSRRLLQERQASPHTIAAYRDTFRLLFRFACAQLRKQPSTLILSDLDARAIGRFLRHLEVDRRNTARSRNHRLSAIHSFYRYLALEEPAFSRLIQQVLAIPMKRAEKRLVAHLKPNEVAALLDAPDLAKASGRRDRLLLLVAIETGLRVSELIGLRWKDVVFGAGAHIRCTGKGRKERCTPLPRELAAALAAWREQRGATEEDLVFTNARGIALSRDGVAFIVRKHARAAKRSCPSLNDKRVSPHVLRHTTAMRLLGAGIDRSVIALWLGHESVETTQVYIDADLQLKERVLKKTAHPTAGPLRFRPSDALLSFLDQL